MERAEKVNGVKSMICTKCGCENGDQAKLCGACGHKLQSGWQNAAEQDGAPLLEAPAPLLGGGHPRRMKTRGHVEAWILALLLGLGAFWLVQIQAAWAVIPLAVLIGAWAFMRGVGWKD